MNIDIIQLCDCIPGLMDDSVEFLSVVVSAVSLLKRVAESVKVVGVSFVDGAAANFKIE